MPMKLFEVLSYEEIEGQFRRASDKAYGGRRPPELTALAKQMIALRPEFAYDGVMYRIIALPKSVIEQSNSTIDVLQYIHDHAGDPTKFISWSRELKGVIRYHNLVADEISNGHNQAFVILDQQAEGFDYRRWIKSYHHERGINAGHLFSTVQVYEVLAPLTEEVRIGLFFIPHGKDYLKFTPSKFAQFKQALSGENLESSLGSDSPYYTTKSLRTLHGDVRKSRVGINHYDPSWNKQK